MVCSSCLWQPEAADRYMFTSCSPKFLIEAPHCTLYGEAWPKMKSSNTLYCSLLSWNLLSNLPHYVGASAAPFQAGRDVDEPAQTGVDADILGRPYDAPPPAVFSLLDIKRYGLCGQVELKALFSDAFMGHVDHRSRKILGTVGKIIYIFPKAISSRIRFSFFNNNLSSVSS